MRFLLPIAGLTAALFVSGCETSPVPMGRDTYMMTDTGAWSWSSGAALKAGLYQKADGFCRARGKELMPVATRQNNGDFSTFAHAELQFFCLASNDPELRRPNLERSPDIVIQSR